MHYMQKPIIIAIAVAIVVLAALVFWPAGAGLIEEDAAAVAAALTDIPGLQIQKLQPVW
jgi:hypothetical protein